MRHRKKFNHLSRKTAHRKAMLSNMAISLIEHKRIKTTVAKAKALRIFVEPLITKSKTDTTHSRRMVFKKLQNKHAVSELFREISQKVSERQGGYTRILKTGNRLGDNAEMCIIELVDYNENYFTDKLSTTKRKRTRRGKSKVEETTSETVQTTDDNVEEEKIQGEMQDESTEEIKTESITEEIKEEEIKEEVKDESIEEEVKAEETKEEDIEDKKEDKE